ncbi:hypothetical protein D1007_36313 [Hordeum vulgare]|nr:hypothetical protein D1007_36313 [Hordeum vulgare]
MSTVRLLKLSLEELKINLSDHVACSEKALKETTLHWKFPGLIRDGVMSSALVMLHDQRSVLEMANHITDVGVMDIYSKMPEVFSEQEHCHWEDEYAQEQQQHSVGVEQQKYSEEQHSEDQRQENVGAKEQQHTANAEEQQEKAGAKEQQHTANAEEQQEKAGAKEHMEEPEPWKFSNMPYQPDRTYKLPVSRGKSVVVEEEVNNDSDESDGDYAIPPTKSNSSASDDKVLELRKYA